MKSKPIKKTCRVCKEEKLYDEMASNGKSKVDGTSLRKNICRLCANKQRELARSVNISDSRGKSNYKRVWKHSLWKKYGIIPEDYDRMFLEQEGKCKICQALDQKLKVDHCHSTGKVRGLLCNSCNSGIGMLKEDPVIFQSALNYLQATE